MKIEPMDISKRTMNIVPPEALDIDPAVTCCVTGHRPKNLPGEGNILSPQMRVLMSIMMMHIKNAFEEGYRTFLSGMADGTDILFAHLVHDLNHQYPEADIRLICCLPYKEQKRELTPVPYRYFYELFAMVYPCVIISQAYDKKRYAKRNKFMVDNSSLLIGVLKNEGFPSGSLQTVNYARKKGIETRLILLDRTPELFGDTEEKDSFPEQHF